MYSLRAILVIFSLGLAFIAYDGLKPIMSVNMKTVDVLHDGDIDKFLHDIKPDLRKMEAYSKVVGAVFD